MVCVCVSQLLFLKQDLGVDGARARRLALRQRLHQVQLGVGQILLHDLWLQDGGGGRTEERKSGRRRGREGDLRVKMAQNKEIPAVRRFTVFGSIKLFGAKLQIHQISVNGGKIYSSNPNRVRIQRGNELCFVL